MSSLAEFQIIRKIGDGSYSTVYHVRRKSDRIEYALKKVKLKNLSEKELKNSINEVRILASIHDDNVISYKNAFFDKLSQCLCIVMEYANDGDLLTKINDHIKNNSTFKEDQVWKIVIQIVKGLNKLHNLNILHRDMKVKSIERKCFFKPRFDSEARRSKCLENYSKRFRIHTNRHSLLC